MKTQSQCRATLETLALLKNPPVFAKQANISTGAQQVDDNMGQAQVEPVPRAGLSESAPNKLLEGRLVDGVDFGAEGEAIRGYSALEAVEAVHRAADAGRQGAGRPKRAQSRRLRGCGSSIVPFAATCHPYGMAP
jgi:hypothetical protein